MKYRFTEVYSSQAPPSANGTVAVKLDISDPISMLFIEYKAIRGSVTSIDHVAANLPKIELVDGSDVIFSLSGKEMMALAHYDKGVSPYSLISNVPTIMEIAGIPYNFGRYLGDPLLAFDPKKFKNPILNITHKSTNNDAAGSTENLRVLAAVFDEKVVNPAGYLMSKEIETPSWVASAAKSTVVLPCDYPFRSLMLRGAYAGYYPHQVINHFKLSEDSDKRVPIDLDMSAYQKIIFSMYPQFKELAQYQVTTTPGNNMYCTPHFDIALSGQQVSGTTPLIINPFNYTNPIALIGAATTNACLQVSGHAPHGCVLVPFGDPQNIDDWYDVTSLKSLKLIMTGGAAGSSSSVNVVGQQYRKY